MIELPSGAEVRVDIPHPPQIVMAVPGPTQAAVIPVPGPPGLTELTPEQLESITEDIEESLEPPVDLVVVFENALQ